MAAVTRREYAGGAAATDLSSSISNSTLTIPITSGTGWPTGAQGPFYIVIGRGTATEEKVLCDSRSGNTITANASGRGADDTSAASHDSGVAVEHAWSAQDADDANKVAAALTTKGDLLGFGTELTRVPVGADDAFFVADSSDAEGVVWKAIADVVTLLQGVAGGLPIHAVKGATESVTSSTTMQNDDALVISLLANSTYVFDVLLGVDGPAGGGDIKLAFTVPTGASLAWGGHDALTVEFVNGSGSESVRSLQGTSTPLSINLRGYVATGATAGNLQLQWAQNSSHGTATRVRAGSWLRAMRSG